MCARTCRLAFRTNRPCEAEYLSPCQPLSSACLLHTRRCPHRKLRVPFSLLCSLSSAIARPLLFSPLPPITTPYPRVTRSDFDIIGYPPEIEPEAIQKAPSRARAQRSAAPPPAAPPPYESSSSVGGDASVDRSSLMSSFTHTYESTSIARVDARTANPYPSMSGASARQEVDYVLYDVDPFNATQTPTRGTKHNRMCTCVRVICARAFDVQYVIVRA